MGKKKGRKAAPLPPLEDAAPAPSEDPEESAGRDGSDEEPAGETRGQMQQRHKRELLMLKKQIAKLGKKRKDEANKLEQEIAERHALEVRRFEERAAESARAQEEPAATDAGASDEPRRPSRAQKRREAKAKEEAERDARIALERANLGETEEELEWRELGDKLEPLGFRVKEVAPDGHCMFRSLEDQLAFQSTESLGFDTKPFDHLGLRRLAASHIRKHADQFAPFIAEEGSEDAGVEGYCARLEETAEWGGHVELQAIAEALEVVIEVYSAQQPIVKIGEGKEGAPLRLSYHLHAYGLGEHYNSVRPIAL